MTSLWLSEHGQAGRAWLGVGTPTLDTPLDNRRVISGTLFSHLLTSRCLETIVMQPASPTGPLVSLRSEKSFLVSFYKTGLYCRMAVHGLPQIGPTRYEPGTKA